MNPPCTFGLRSFALYNLSASNADDAPDVTFDSGEEFAQH